MSKNKSYKCKTEVFHFIQHREREYAIETLLEVRRITYIRVDKKRGDEVMRTSKMLTTTYGSQ